MDLSQSVLPKSRSRQQSRQWATDRQYRTAMARSLLLAVGALASLEQARPVPLSHHDPSENPQWTVSTVVSICTAPATRAARHPVAIAVALTS